MRLLLFARRGEKNEDDLCSTYWYVCIRPQIPVHLTHSRACDDTLMHDVHERNQRIA